VHHWNVPHLQHQQFLGVEQFYLHNAHAQELLMLKVRANPMVQEVWADKQTLGLTERGNRSRRDV